MHAFMKIVCTDACLCICECMPNLLFFTHIHCI